MGQQAPAHERFAAAHAEANEGSGGSVSESRQVLVVDDDPMIRCLLTDMLTLAGCMVVQAEDGCAALEWVNSRAFDVIVLDLQMPHMDGRAFLERYAEQAGHRAHVIICSAYADVDPQVGELPAVAFLKKPFSLCELYAAVESNPLESCSAPGLPHRNVALPGGLPVARQRCSP
jgi:CheY-like chemotaxis protein